MGSCCHRGLTETPVGAPTPWCTPACPCGVRCRWDLSGTPAAGGSRVRSRRGWGRCVWEFRPCGSVGAVGAGSGPQRVLPVLLPVPWGSHVLTEGFGHPGGAGVGGRECARVPGQPGYRGTRTQCQALPPALTSLRKQHLAKCPPTWAGPCSSHTPRVCRTEVPRGVPGAGGLPWVWGLSRVPAPTARPRWDPLATAVQCRPAEPSAR